MDDDILFDLTLANHIKWMCLARDNVIILLILTAIKENLVVFKLRTIEQKNLKLFDLLFCCCLF